SASVISRQFMVYLRHAKNWKSRRGDHGRHARHWSPNRATVCGPRPLRRGLFAYRRFGKIDVTLAIQIGGCPAPAVSVPICARRVRVNAVCPVYVKTPTILASLKRTSSPAKGGNVDRYLESFAATPTAFGRLPTATEVAELVYFLAGPQASAITGQCINVDCG